MAIVNYHCAKGRLIGEDTNGIRTDYMTDALGSVTGTVNSSQAVVNTYRYKPFGDLLAKTGTGADPKFMWNGSTQSRRTGLGFSDQYNRARHYGTRQGQWTTVDPLWPRERAYGYSWATPTALADPSGTNPLCWLISKDDWLKDPWNRWDKNCAGEHQADIDRGFSHARRALARLCSGKSGTDANNRYRKCLELNGISPSRSAQIAKCLCDIFLGGHPIMLYCGSPNHDLDDEGKNGMVTERGRPCKITIIPGYFGLANPDPDAPPFDADTIGKGILHEFGHCCGGSHKSPKGDGFPIALHDKCMISAIHWGWGDWKELPR